MANLGSLKLKVELDGISEAQFKKKIKNLTDRRDKMSVQVEMDANEAKKQVDILTQKLKQVQKHGDKIQFDKMSQELAKANIKLKEANAKVKTLDTHFDSLGKKTSLFSSLLGKFGGLALGVGLAKVGQSALLLGDNLEKSQISFEVMLGSAEKAKDMLADLSNFAKKTPFELTNIRQNAKQLMAMGVAADDMIPTMKSLGDVSAALNIPLERLALNYGQVLTQGKLTGVEMKDFRRMGIDLTDTLAEITGKNSESIAQMVTDSQISSGIVVEAFRRITSEGGRFANMMEKSQTTLSAKISNLKDDLAALGEKIGTFLLPIFKKLVHFLSRLVSFIQTPIGKFLTLATVIGVVSGMILPFIFSLGGLATAFTSAAAAGGGLAAVLGVLGGPITLIAGALGVLGASAYFVYDAMSEQAEKTRELAEASKTLEEKINDQIIAQEELNRQKEEGIITEDEYKQKMQESTDKLNRLKAMTELATDAQYNFKNIKEKVMALKNKGDIAGLQAEMGTVKALIAHYKGLIRAKQIAMNAQLEGLRKQQEINRSLASIEVNGSANITGPGSLQMDHAQKERYDTLISVAEQENEKLQKEFEVKTKGLREEIEVSKKALAEIEKVEKMTAGAIKSVGGGGTRSRGSSGGGSGKSKKVEQTEEEKKAAEALKKKIKQLENAERQLGRTMDELKKKSDKMRKAEKKWQETLKKGNKDIQKGLKKIQDEYQETIDKLNADHNTSQEDRAKNFYQNLLSKKEELEKAIREDEYQVFKGDGYTESDDERKLRKVQAQLAKFEQKFSQYSEVFSAQQERMKVGEDEREYLDFLAEWEQAEQEVSKKLINASNEMMKKTEAMNEQKRVLSFFQTNDKRGLALENNTKIFKNSLQSEEARNLANKLLKEKQQLQQITDEKIAAENTVHREAMLLANSYHEAEMSMIAAKKEEYNTLIAKIQQAIAAANALRSAKSGTGFALGGYTGDGGMFEPAGTVHKGEYVISQPMMAKVKSLMPNTLPALEKIRTGGGVTHSSTVNRSVSINGPINVRDDIDFEQMLARVKWKL